MASSTQAQAQESERFAAELRRSGCTDTADRQDTETARLQREAAEG
jgi:hypothetical protein